MANFLDLAQRRDLLLGGKPVTKSTGTLAATTVQLFTVAGGIVCVTSLVGLVTTSITVANSYKLQHDPTAGDTSDIVAATDIGTTDTVAGTVLGFSGTPGDSIEKGAAGLSRPLFLPAGEIESVSAGTDGVITWYLTWVPLEVGATVVAAA